MGFTGHRIALGLAATAALLGAVWFAARGSASNEAFAALVPAGEAPTRLTEAPVDSGSARTSEGTREPRSRQAESSERVPVEDALAAPAGAPSSFFERRGLGTLAGSLAIHAPDRWPRSPEDSNLRLRIAPTTRIPEFELSGIFRGQLPLSAMTPLGEFDGVQRWSFDAGELPCGDYTLTVLPTGGATRVTIERERESHATVSLRALEPVELCILENGQPYAARGARYSPWSVAMSEAAPGGRSTGTRQEIVPAKAGRKAGVFVLNATAGEHEVTIDLGDLGALRRNVFVPLGGGRITIEVTRTHAIELWIEDEHGRSVQPAWAAQANVTVVAGEAELQSVRSLARSLAETLQLTNDVTVLLRDGAVAQANGLDLTSPSALPEAEPGPSAIWYFTGPGTAEFRLQRSRREEDPGVVSLPIGVGQPTRWTVRLEPMDEPFLTGLPKSTPQRVQVHPLLRGVVR